MGSDMSHFGQRSSRNPIISIPGVKRNPCEEQLGRDIAKKKSHFFPLPFSGGIGMDRESEQKDPCVSRVSPSPLVHNWSVYCLHLP